MFENRNFEIDIMKIKGEVKFTHPPQHQNIIKIEVFKIIWIKMTKHRAKLWNYGMNFQILNHLTILSYFLVTLTKITIKKSLQLSHFNVTVEVWPMNLKLENSFRFIGLTTVLMLHFFLK